MALPNSPEAYEMMREAFERYMRLSPKERMEVNQRLSGMFTGRKFRDAVADPCDRASTHRS